MAVGSLQHLTWTKRMKMGTRRWGCLSVSAFMHRCLCLSLSASLSLSAAMSLCLSSCLSAAISLCLSFWHSLLSCASVRVRPVSPFFFYLVACLHSICKPHSDVTPNLRLLQKGTQMKLTPTTRKREMPPMKQMQGSTEFQRTYQGKGKGPPLHPQRQSLNG